MAAELARKLIRVPDVVGLPLKKAMLIMQNAGLQVEAVVYKESYEDKDAVLEQKPRNQMVYHGQQVVLTVSRESYIKWLPAIYQRTDPTGKNFVRDILWIVQHLFGSIEDRLEIIHTYFDSYETPEEFLPWLAGWSAMVLEADWPINKKRRLIKKAMELYRLRGTVKGLTLFIKLFTDFEPTLRENEWPFEGFRIGVSSSVGINTVILPPVDKSRAFVVVLPHKFRDLSPESIIRLHDLIDKEKPAHTSYILKFEEPKVSVEEREFYVIGIRSGINIGDEVITPLPISEESGEPDYPVDVVTPPAPPDPSVYELFATRRRQLPKITSAPRADNAPVEDGGVKTSKAGFEGVREFNLDDIMKELLKQQGGEAEAGTASKATAGDVPEAPPSLSGGAVVVDPGVGSLSGAKAPRIEFSLGDGDEPAAGTPDILDVQGGDKPGDGSDGGTK